VVQEVLTVVARDIAEFRYDPQRGSFRGWLKTILAYQLRAYWRRRQAHPAGVGDSHWQERLNELEDPHSQLSGQWDTEHHAYVARRALDLIKTEFEPTTWQAFWLVVMEERKPADVATELRVSRNAVYIAKYRVLERLRQVTDGLVDSLEGGE
jgi:RNA polymerase sigma-70 factor (ECF subfamily)